jgi:hypothetical protein
VAAKSRSEIIDDFEDYIAKRGGRHREWFVGCTGSPKAALGKRHGVQKNDAWISRLAKDEYEAHDIAEFFITTRGARGRLTETKDTDLYVYAFKMLAHHKA